jgi:hypothetical protein
MKRQLQHKPEINLYFAQPDRVKRFSCLLLISSSKQSRVTHLHQRMQVPSTNPEIVLRRNEPLIEHTVAESLTLEQY